jgi:hypothetical protein
LSAVALGEFGKRAAEPVADEHQDLPGDDAAGDTDAPVGAPSQPCVQDVEHARLD